MPPLPPIWPVFALLAATVAAAVVTVRWGVRRRAGAGPVCRRCEYDVSHRPPGVTRCSECGADLTRPGAIATGGARVRPWRLGLGLAATAVGFGLLVSTAAPFPYRSWMAANAPLPWVIRLARGNPSEAGTVYRAAWQVRGGGAGSAPFVDHLLDLQADPVIVWTGRWDPLLAAAYGGRRMTPAQADWYLRQMFGPLTVTARSAVRAGDPLVVRAGGPPGRGTLPGSAARAVFAARADGPAVLDPSAHWTVGTLRSSSSTAYSTAFAPGQWCPNGIGPGHHRVEIAVGRDLVVGSPGRTGYQSVSPMVITTATVDVEVLPAGAPLAAARPNPAVAEPVARAVDLHVYHWHDGRVFAVVGLLPASADRAFRVSATVGTATTTIGTVAAPAGGTGTTNAVRVPVDAGAAAALADVTVTLTGDPDATRETMDQSAYWPGRITYPDVPVQPWADYAKDAQRASTPTTRPFRVEPGT